MILIKKLLPAFILSACLHFICTERVVIAQSSTAARARIATDAQHANAARDREIAAHFAPVFYQGLGDKQRHDYITNFDFDGDWRGDNNWDNSADERFPLRAFVYYAVSETPTHFLIHYAVFHPRDYKGGSARGPVLSRIIREGVRRGGRYDPTGLSAEAVLAHENDMEGCLVAAAKAGADFKQARVAFVETLAHDRFLKYTTEAVSIDERGRPAFDSIRLEAAHAELYVEPKGHGISARVGGEKQAQTNGTIVYRYAGRADDPGKSPQDATGYDLLPLSTTLWPRARGGVNQTFGAVYKYGARAFSFAQTSERVQKRNVNLGTLGTAFRGNKGASNMARPPWGWFDRNDAGQAQGAWFFDPAATIKRHFRLGDDFSVAYTHAPFLNVSRKL